MAHMLVPLNHTENEDDTLHRFAAALLVHLPQRYSPGNFIQLEFNEHEAVEKVTLVTVEKLFPMLREHIELWKGASHNADPPLHPLMSRAFHRADYLCRWQLSGAQGERASMRIWSDESEQYLLVWRYAHRQWVRNPERSRSSKLMILKSLMSSFGDGPVRGGVNRGAALPAIKDEIQSSPRQEKDRMSTSVEYDDEQISEECAGEECSADGADTDVTSEWPEDPPDNWCPPADLLEAEGYVTRPSAKRSAQKNVEPTPTTTTTKSEIQIRNELKRVVALSNAAHESLGCFDVAAHRKSVKQSAEKNKQHKQ